jgi:hypothetical protein
MEINSGLLQVRVTQQKLNRAEIRASFQQVCGVCMAQGVLVLLMISTPARFATRIIRSTE